ncbi:MAG: Crp/Fnr family transcriptional regulator [Cyanobacteria bacterium P01_G01_bin.38]
MTMLQISQQSSTQHLSNPLEQRPLVQRPPAQRPLAQQPSPALKVPFKRRELLPIKGQNLWKIHDGYVRVITWDEEGCVIPVSFWGPGSLVGAALIFMHPYEIQCLTPVSAEQLNSQLHMPSTMMIEQTQQALTLLRILHCRHVDCRLLQFICWLADRFGHRVPEGRSLPIKITHQELADAIGTTRVTITRFLKQFELEGLLQWSGKSRVVYGPTLQRIHVSIG